MPSPLVDKDFNHLVQAIYRGAVAQRPWHCTLPALREAIDAQVVSLVLRPPSAGDRGFILNCVRPGGAGQAGDAVLADPGDWEVTAYREQFFSLDPFINLPLDRIITLDDLLGDAELMASDYYQHYLQPIGLFRILGVDTGEPEGLLARLRFSRRRDEAPFSARDREVLALITPHLHLALEIYARLNQMTSERDIYAGAIDQLSVATIILDEQGRLLNTNALASALLKEGDGLSLRGKHLRIESRSTDRELQSALGSVIAAQRAGETSVVKALRVPRPGGRPPLGLVIRPVPVGEWAEGQAGPCAAVFLSDPEQHDSASQQTLGELFGLTPAESNVAILLARGLSLAEVSQVQNISPHTARAQLKSIFAKTGVSRQAELVRMIIKSVASLA
ncbi:MAG: helix-turn-helix transcriptional regulator [Halieaceae bacterium]|jgi:DNA-binding CsgD family transcriptional regulator|nr:helix-turn-helix transcriptional regulator [Halieaceae bacterium]